MTYNADIRREIKAEQKEIAKANRGKLMGAQVICALPILLISVISVVWYFRTMGVLEGAAFQSEVDRALNSVNDMQSLSMVLQLLIGAPLTMGLMGFFIRLMRGEQTTAGSVLHPLSSLKTFFRAIRMGLVLYVRSLIWMIGPTILMSACLTGAMFANMDANGSLSGDGIIAIAIIALVYLVVVMLISVKISMYQAGYIHLHDNEFIGTWDASRAANEAFRGHYKNLLVFYLSFAPWYLLYFALLFAAAIPFSAALVAADGMITSGVLGGGAISVALCILVELFLGTFLTAYQNMSFLRLYERIAPAPEQPVDYAEFQVSPQSWQPVTPKQEEEAAAPQEEETPAAPENEKRTDTLGE